MRSFSEFHIEADDATRAQAEHARVSSAATWSYLLLRPGMEFVRQRSNFILGWQAAAAAGESLTGGVSAGAVGTAGRPPLGSWMILPDLTTPATQTVLPSNDALYGAAQVELDRCGPTVLSVPANIDERYYSVTVMDAHMNKVAHIGPRWTGNGAGDFALVPPGWDGPLPDGLPAIACPTVSVVVFNRMLVQYTDGDIDRVRSWQAGLRITALADWPDRDAIPPEVDVADLVHPDINTMTSARDYLRIGQDHLARNPVVAEASWLAALASDNGLTAGHGPEFDAALEAGVDDATAMIDVSLATWPRANGWRLPDPALGLPNPHVLRSAAFQQYQIGSNDIDEAAYYFADQDATGAPLDAGDGREYGLTFAAGDLPPVHPDGYWSVTMYDREGHLVANSLDRYATRATRPGTVLNEDGGLTLTFSAHQPAGVPLANWLPAPAGPFQLGIRLYYPLAGSVRAGWVPPPVLLASQGRTR
jgi:hypothetical protein